MTGLLFYPYRSAGHYRHRESRKGRRSGQGVQCARVVVNKKGGLRETYWKYNSEARGAVRCFDPPLRRRMRNARAEHCRVQEGIHYPEQGNSYRGHDQLPVLRDRPH